MSKLYLVRHGQTYFNLWHKIQGWCDSPLTPQGIRQAKEVGAYFKQNKIHFDRAYCSTAERASDTLELITRQPYKRLKGLKECYFGQFEGQDERLNPQPPYGDFFLQYGGESEAQVQQRMKKTLTQIMDQTKKDEQILVVSYAGAMVNFAVSLGLNARKIIASGFQNCSILEFNYTNKRFEFKRLINASKTK